MRQPINARILRDNLPDDARYVAVTISGAHIGWILRASHIPLYHGLSYRCCCWSACKCQPGASVQQFNRASLPPQLLDRSHDRPPDQRAFGVAVVEQLICPLGRSNRCVLAMLVDQELGGAVEVEVRAQKALRLRSPAEAPASLCH